MERTTVGVRLLAPLLSYMRVRDIDVDALVTRVGLETSAFAEPDARVDAGRSVRLWHEAERELRDPLLGLHVGATVTRESFDLLSQATAVSGTFREMGQRLTRLSALAMSGPLYELREVGDSAWWIVGDVFPAQRCVRHLCELTVSLGLAYMRHLAPDARAPRRVHFDHAAAADPAEYARVLGGPVLFSQHESGFEIPRELLDLPLPRADPGLARVLDRVAEEALRRLPHDADLRQRVQAALGRLVDGGTVVDLGVLAKQLAMSPRSLQRHLSAQGHSFQQLLDEQRQRTALRLLQQDGASLGQVAEQLGFSDLAAFRRAFKRWTGMSPRAYRMRA